MEKMARKSISSAVVERPAAAQPFTGEGSGVKRAMDPAPARNTMASMTRVKSRAERNDMVGDCSTGAFGGRSWRGFWVAQAFRPA